MQLVFLVSNKIVLILASETSLKFSLRVFQWNILQVLV